MPPNRTVSRAPCGWLAIDKPPGLRSTAVVQAVRSAIRSRRVGHAGTLDAPASGVLAIAVGEATKTVAMVMDAAKQYRFTVIFGAATMTDDAEGSVLESRSLRPTDDEITAALTKFRGDIMQVPPAYSAVRLAGKRAHALAREGQTVTLPARPLHVARLEMIDRPDPDRATFEMVCGKGGYVRAIARDLGTELKCLGHVQDLQRLRTGPFTLDDCISIDTLHAVTDPAQLSQRLLPIEIALGGRVEVPCSEAERERIVNGVAIRTSDRVSGEGTGCWMSCNGKVIALAEHRDGLIWPRRIIHQP